MCTNIQIPRLDRLKSGENFLLFRIRENPPGLVLMHYFYDGHIPYLLEKQIPADSRLTKLIGKETLTILHSFFFLSIIQLTNFLLPLIVLPFLIRVVGIERVGIIALAQALMSYFIIITDYGFNLTATRDISHHRQDLRRNSEIVSRVLVLKTVLAVLTFIVLIFLLNLINKFRVNAQVYYWSFLLVLGQVLIPTWFFQGIEKMKYLALINVSGKIVFVLLIFFFIRAPEDYLYAIVFLSLGNIVAGIIGLWIMFRRFGIYFILPGKPELKAELYNGWYVMISNFSINVYINSNIFILGLFTNNTIVGYYSVADKILYALRQVLNLFFQATYPQACKQMESGQQKLIRFFKKHFIPFLGGVIVICLVTCLAAPLISRLFLRKEGDMIVHMIRLLCLVPVIVCCNIPAYQTLLIYHFQRSIMQILISGALLNVILNIILTKYFQVNGTIATVIITELFITLGLNGMLAIRYPQNKLF
jgi:polysaccharide transporter, PST family